MGQVELLRPEDNLAGSAPPPTFPTQVDGLDNKALYQLSHLHGPILSFYISALPRPIPTHTESSSSKKLTF